MRLSRSKQFKKDMRNLSLSMGDKQFQSLVEALTFLINEEPLPSMYRDHALSGRLSGYREFYVGGDTIVLYTVEDEVIYLLRVGSHAEVLGM